jgi:hypothetical protein
LYIQNICHEYINDPRRSPGPNILNKSKICHIKDTRGASFHPAQQGRKYSAVRDGFKQRLKPTMVEEAGGENRIPLSSQNKESNLIKQKATEDHRGRSIEKRSAE